jgi:hypothetical protein
MANRLTEKLKRDTLGLIWIVFIASLVVMTLWFKPYIKDLIIISILFLVFCLLEPFLLHSGSKEFANILPGGRAAPRWKKFPIFFGSIILLYFVYALLEEAMGRALPTGGINLVFVAIWIILLFIIYNYQIIRK